MVVLVIHGLVVLVWVAVPSMITLLTYQFLVIVQVQMVVVLLELRVSRRFWFDPGTINLFPACRKQCCHQRNLLLDDMCWRVLVDLELLNHNHLLVVQLRIYFVDVRHGWWLRESGSRLWRFLRRQFLFLGHLDLLWWRLGLEGIEGIGFIKIIT